MRPVTDEEVEAYRQDGFVHLKGFLDDEWFALVEAAFHDEMSAEGVHQLDTQQLSSFLGELGRNILDPEANEASANFLIRTFNWSNIPSVAALGRESPLGSVTADLMGADRINFYGEQLFSKEAGSIRRTAFHQDAPYFHLSGDQACTVWMPLDSVDASNGMMGYVRGSHTWEIHAANGFVTQDPIFGSTLEPLPDIEGNEADYDIVWCPAEPGDAIVHHVRTAHGSTGNTSDRYRRALALRFLGEDVRYLERTGTPDDSQRSPTLAEGDVMDSPEFPLIWTRSGGAVGA